MPSADHKAVDLFIQRARERLAWMNEEHARLESESERRALPGARKELVPLLGRVAEEKGGAGGTR